MLWRRKPFSESVVDAIGRATYTQLGFLGGFIRGTEIQGNHLGISEAWKERTATLGYPMEAMGVLKSLTEPMSHTRKPFSISMVDAIRGTTQTDLGFLAGLIAETDIASNHDAIIAAWKARAARHGYGENFMGVLNSLLSRKHEPRPPRNLRQLRKQPNRFDHFTTKASWAVLKNCPLQI